MTPETKQQLDATDKRMRGRMEPWKKKAFDLIASKISDARSHAMLAITQTAKEAKDGRPTLRAIRRNRSFQAAQARLDELRDVLTGGSIASVSGLVRDAREAFYRDSFELWKESIPEESWVSPDPSPTARGVAAVRGMVVRDAELHTQVSLAVERAKNELVRATNGAALRFLDAKQRRDSLETWERQSGQSLAIEAKLALSDGDQRAHALACLDLINPIILDEESLAMSSHGEE